MQKLKLILIIYLICTVQTIQSSTIQIRNIAGSIGVEILGMDLSSEIRPEEVNLIGKLLQERLVVVIKNQNITAEQQTYITSKFGDVEIAWDKKNRHPNDPRVHVITNEGTKKNPNYISSTYFWHWDKSFIRYPTRLSFAFFPTKAQPKGFGTTGFMNAYTAYECLPEALKEEIDQLYAIHSYDIMSNLRKQNYEKASLEFKKGNEKFPDVFHPLVGKHPLTEKFTLNVDELSQGNIIGLTEQESAELRKKLFEHSIRQGDFYFHEWEEGDFVIWDNLALLHRGMPSDPDTHRVLHRTNISSRALIEGRCILIASDLESEQLAFIFEHLFTQPLVINTDDYIDLTILENDIKLLRLGQPIQKDEQIIRPHALVILKGEKWKKSPKITSLIHAFVSSQISQELAFEFNKNVRLISYSANYRELEDFCLEHFLLQDIHERLMSGELSSDHLSKKLQILVSSCQCFTEDDGSFDAQRMQIHANLLAQAFKDTNINKSPQEWLDYLRNRSSVKESKIKDSLNASWLLYLGGGQGVGKTTLLKKMKESKILSTQTLTINSRLFFDFLFNDIPLSHKIKLWPYIYEEKKYLTLLISKIALENQISVVIDTHILSEDFCKSLTDVVKEMGAESIMIAMCAPLEVCYFREQSSLDSEVEKAQDLIYEELMFHKLFASNWHKFVPCFDVSFLIDQSNDQKNDRLLFLSERDRNIMLSKERVDDFLNLTCIDPDELANEIAPLNIEKGVQAIRRHILNTSSQKSKQFAPEGTQLVPKFELSQPSLMSEKLKGFINES